MIVDFGFEILILNLGLFRFEISDLGFRIYK